MKILLSNQMSKTQDQRGDQQLNYCFTSTVFISMNLESWHQYLNCFIAFHTSSFWPARKYLSLHSIHHILMWQFKTTDINSKFPFAAFLNLFQWCCHKLCIINSLFHDLYLFNVSQLCICMYINAVSKLMLEKGMSLNLYKMLCINLYLAEI